jgi:hypothetical protein
VRAVRVYDDGRWLRGIVAIGSSRLYHLCPFEQALRVDRPPSGLSFILMILACHSRAAFEGSEREGRNLLVTSERGLEGVGRSC